MTNEREDFAMPDGRAAISVDPAHVPGTDISSDPWLDLWREHQEATAAEVAARDAYLHVAHGRGDAIHEDHKGSCIHVERDDRDGDTFALMQLDLANLDRLLERDAKRYPQDAGRLKKILGAELRRRQTEIRKQREALGLDVLEDRWTAASERADRLGDRLEQQDPTTISGLIAKARHLRSLFSDEPSTVAAIGQLIRAAVRLASLPLPAAGDAHLVAAWGTSIEHMKAMSAAPSDEVLDREFAAFDRLRDFIVRSPFSTLAGLKVKLLSAIEPAVVDGEGRLKLFAGGIPEATKSWEQPECAALEILKQVDAMLAGQPTVANADAELLAAWQTICRVNTDGPYDEEALNVADDVLIQRPATTMDGLRVKLLLILSRMDDSAAIEGPILSGQMPEDSLFESYTGRLLKQVVLALPCGATPLPSGAEALAAAAAKLDQQQGVVS
jgi:hypothetical protein